MPLDLIPRDEAAVLELYDLLEPRALNAYNAYILDRTRWQWQVQMKSVITGSASDPAMPAYEKGYVLELYNFLTPGAEVEFNAYILTRTPAEWQAEMMEVIAANSPIGYRVFNFTSELPANVTFARASAAWHFNASNVLVQSANDVPRFGPNGMLIEGASTNSIRNNAMIGAIAGTPGTLPTGWAASVSNGITRQIVGFGQEDGIDYIDLRYFGTCTAATTYSITPTAASLTAAAQFQVWTGSFFVKLQAGSFSGVTNGNLTHIISGRDNANSQISGLTRTFTPTGAALRTQRGFITHTLVGASITRVDTDLRIVVALDAVIDLTLRIGMPQLEQGQVMTSPIRTTLNAVTRANELVDFVGDVAFSRNAIAVNGTAHATNPASLTPTLVHLGTGTDAKLLYRAAASNNMTQLVVASSVVTVNSVAGAVAAGASFKIAGRFETDHSAVSLNGAAVVSDVSCAMPVVTSGAKIGRQAGDVMFWNGAISRIELRPTATDAELVALST